jgi:hypothetical protein
MKRNGQTLNLGRGTNITAIVAKYRHRIPIVGTLFGSKSLHLSADLMVVCLWAILGLAVTALVAAFDTGADIAGILAVAE